MPSLFFSYAPDYHKHHHFHRKELVVAAKDRKVVLDHQFYDELEQEHAIQEYNERQVIENRDKARSWTSERYADAVRRWKARQLDVVAKKRAHEVTYVEKVVASQKQRDAKLTRADNYRKTLTGIYDNKARLLNSISDSALTIATTHPNTLGGELLLPDSPSRAVIRSPERSTSPIRRSCSPSRRSPTNRMRRTCGL